MKNHIVLIKKFLLSIVIMCLLYVIIRYIVFPKVVFPTKYKEQVFMSAKKHHIDPFLVFAIMKAESKFDPNALSRRGAKGLMQIMDTTGAWSATELGILDFTPDQLFEPEVNIEIGCWYIARLFNQYEGHIPTLLAAYNAGTGNIYKWRNDKKYSLDGITIHNIPFRETKQYVKRVMMNLKFYTYLY